MHQSSLHREESQVREAERQSLVAENLKNVDMCRRRDLEDLQVQEAERQTLEQEERKNVVTLLLTNRLHENGRVMQPVDDRGHCQFDSIAKQLRRFGVLKTYRDVRRDVAGWLRQNPSFKLANGTAISEYLDRSHDARTWEDFCDLVEDVTEATSPFWGNHLTLLAAANVYEWPIRVWSTHEGQLWEDIDPVDKESGRRKLRLEIAHQPEFHYVSVRCTGWKNEDGQEQHQEEEQPGERSALGEARGLALEEDAADDFSTHPGGAGDQRRPGVGRTPQLSQQQQQLAALLACT